MCLSCFDFGFSTHYNATTSCQIGFTNAAYAIYISACREVGCFNVVHEFFYRDFRIINVSIAGIDNLRQVVWRHVCSHTYSNTGSTVNEKIWDTCRHYSRFIQCVIEISIKVDSFLVKVFHHGFSQLVQSCFCITHGSRAVTVNGTEVSLTIY